MMRVRAAVQADPVETALCDWSTNARDLAASTDPLTVAAWRVAGAMTSNLALVQAVPTETVLTELSASACVLAENAVPLALLQVEPAEAAATDTILASRALTATQVAPAPLAFVDLSASTRVLAASRDQPIAAASSDARVTTWPLSRVQEEPSESPLYVDAATTWLVAAVHAAPALVRSRERVSAATVAASEDLEAERTERAMPRAARLLARAMRSRFSCRRYLACSRLSERACCFRLRSSDATNSLSQRSYSFSSSAAVATTFLDRATT